MDYPHITHHGAQNGVTGYCHQLHITQHSSVLVDCGLLQGADASPLGARADHQLIEFPLDGIRALIVTHVHADHVGRIPYLLATGFEGPILCSEPSAKLLPIVLEDAFKLTFSRDEKQVERSEAGVGANHRATLRPFFASRAMNAVRRQYASSVPHI